MSNESLIPEGKYTFKAVNERMGLERFGVKRDGELQAIVRCEIQSGPYKGREVEYKGGLESDFKKYTFPALEEMGMDPTIEDPTKIVLGNEFTAKVCHDVKEKTVDGVKKTVTYYKLKYIEKVRGGGKINAAEARSFADAIRAFRNPGAAPDFTADDGFGGGEAPAFGGEEENPFA